MGSNKFSQDGINTSKSVYSNGAKIDLQSVITRRSKTVFVEGAQVPLSNVSKKNSVYVG